MNYEYLYSLLKIHLMETLPKKKWVKVNEFIKENENRHKTLSNEQISIIKDIFKILYKNI